MNGVSTLQAVQILAVAVLGCALGTLVFAVGSAPQPPHERLGLRGFKRAQSLRDNRLFAVIEPIMRFISQRLYGLISPSLREKLDRQIMIAGDVAGLQPEDVLALTLMTGSAGTALGVLYGGQGGDVIVFGLILGVAGLALPHLMLSSAGEQRVGSIASATPGVIDLLALCLGAGLDFPAAGRPLGHLLEGFAPRAAEVELLQEQPLSQTCFACKQRLHGCIVRRVRKRPRPKLQRRCCCRSRCSS